MVYNNYIFIIEIKVFILNLYRIMSGVFVEWGYGKICDL
jgi:hypothetical protein